MTMVRPQARLPYVAAIVVLTMATGAAIAAAQSPEPPWPAPDRPAWPSSPFHGMRDGDGQIIPCRCRFQGQEYRLGEEVCMSTHTGIVLTRCDLLLNNTSWIPTGTPCTISRLHTLPTAPTAATNARLAAPAHSSRSMATIRSSTNVTR